MLHPGPPHLETTCSVLIKHKPTGSWWWGRERKKRRSVSGAQLPALRQSHQQKQQDERKEAGECVCVWERERSLPGVFFWCSREKGGRRRATPPLSLLQATLSIQRLRRCSGIICPQWRGRREEEVEKQRSRFFFFLRGSRRPWVSPVNSEVRLCRLMHPCCSSAQSAQAKSLPCSATWTGPGCKRNSSTASRCWCWSAHTHPEREREKGKGERESKSLEELATCFATHTNTHCTPRLRNAITGRGWGVTETRWGGVWVREFQGEILLLTSWVFPQLLPASPEIWAASDDSVWSYVRRLDQRWARRTNTEREMTINEKQWFKCVINLLKPEINTGISD